MHRIEGIPDMRFINREVPILGVAGKLDLKLGNNGLFRCWHPERHKNGDRTPSVSVLKSQNKVKCFGPCDSPLMGPVDLVADVRGLTPKDAALWIAEHFEVPMIAPRKHLKPLDPVTHMAGYETPLGMLVRSGLWARLCAMSQRLVPVLLELSNLGPRERTKTLPLSYRAMARYMGVGSQAGISKALRQLEEIGWLKRLGPRTENSNPIRGVAAYQLSPLSDYLQECAQATAAELRAEIKTEKELRKRKRQRRIDAIKLKASNEAKGKGQRTLLQSRTSLSQIDSVKRIHAIKGEA